MNNIDFKTLLFTYTGRINRAQYWTAVVIYIAAMVVLGIITFLIGMGMLFLILAVIVYIPMIVSGVMVGIKRLHDRDKSGWWLLVFYLLPGVLSSLGPTIGANFIFSLAGFAVSVWGLVELGFLRGTPGPNQYGPDPLAGQAVAA